MKRLNVELGERSYPIYIGQNLTANPAVLQDHLHGKQVCIVTNQTVAPLYLDHYQAQLTSQGFEVQVVVLPDGESFKNLDTLNQIFTSLLESRFNRSCTLIALGGGVVGDMTGFAAACYQRGVNFIQVPTTLLSMVDSSVGGKTGVNHALGKNMIGAFYQPQAVLADVALLASLPPREMAAGIAEVIKYGLICDEPFFNWLELNIERLVAKEADALTYAVERSCADKAKVVAMDEREGGIRAILNLGHTFGHAIETAEGYGNWLHGEAVAVGMLMAIDLSVRMGMVSEGVLSRARALIEKSGLPVSGPAGMSNETYLELMSVDKKVLDGKLRLVLLNAMGEACVTSDIDRSALNDTLNAFRSS